MDEETNENATITPPNFGITLVGRFPAESMPSYTDVRIFVDGWCGVGSSDELIDKICEAMEPLYEIDYGK